MIPIRDAIRSKNFPAVNVLIIGLNIIAFLLELLQGPNLKEVFYLYGMVPLRYSNPELAAHFTSFQQYLPFLTSMFLHGGFLHIIMNMWFLYIFGDNIEDRLGHLRYLVFYLFCGVASGLVHLFTNWNPNTPTIGASGAISGVMGAYLLLYPRSKILTLIPKYRSFSFFNSSRSPPSSSSGFGSSYNYFLRALHPVILEALPSGPISGVLSRALFLSNYLISSLGQV